MITVRSVMWHISTILEQAVELLHSDVSLASIENMDFRINWMDCKGLELQGQNSAATAVDEWKVYFLYLIKESAKP